MSTGKPIKILSEDVIEAVNRPAPDDRHDRETRDNLYFEAMMRVLDRELPGYAD
jgi:hypothetical protein